MTKTTWMSVISDNFCTPASTVLVQLPQFMALILVCRVLRDEV
ncbi:hypothetical protein [Microcoleus sp. herbarium5]